MQQDNQAKPGPDLQRLRDNFDAERSSLVRLRAFVMIVCPAVIIGFMLPYNLLRYDHGRLEAWSDLVEAQQQIHIHYVEPLIEVRADLETWVRLYDAHVADVSPIDWNTMPEVQVAWCRLDEAADPVTCLFNGNGLILANLTGYDPYRGTRLVTDGIDDVHCPALVDMQEPPTIGYATRALFDTLRDAQGHLDQILSGESASPPRRTGHEVLRTQIDDAIYRAGSLEACINGIQNATRLYLERGPDTGFEMKEEFHARYEDLEGSIERAQSDLEATIGVFQSPLGSVPISAQHILLLFPIVYAMSASAFSASQRRMGIIYRNYWEAAATAGEFPHDGSKHRDYALMPALPVLERRASDRRSLAVSAVPILIWFAVALWLNLWDFFWLRAWSHTSMHHSVMEVLVIVVDLIAALFIFRTCFVLKASIRDFGVTGRTGVDLPDPRSGQEAMPTTPHETL